MQDLRKIDNFDKLLDKTLLEHDRLVRTDAGIREFFLNRNSNPFSTQEHMPRSKSTKLTRDEALLLQKFYEEPSREETVVCPTVMSVGSFSPKKRATR